jgi:hypothetical protein
LRPPAKDDGFYVVLTPAPDYQAGDSAMAEAAGLLSLKPAELSRAVALSQPLPVARIGTQDEAAAIVQGLRRLGIESVIISNGDLQLDLSSAKIRGLVCSDDDSLTLVPASGGGTPVSVGWNELTLLVTGRLLSNRIEIEERNSRGRKRTVDSRQFSSDEAVLDIYAQSQSVNWRIVAASFDFSCLGSAKSVTTFQNFQALISLMRERAPNAQFDDSYVRARPILETLWPQEEQLRKGELRRKGSSKFDSATVTTTTNEAQFTRYSRLKHCLSMRTLEVGK